MCAEAGVDSVDVGAHYLVAREALRSIESPQAFQLACAGQAPGVTGLMAKQLHEQTGQAVDVGFLLANRGRSGPAGVADMLRIIDTSPRPPVNFHYYGAGPRRSVPAEHNELSITDRMGFSMESLVAFENDLLNEAILALRKIGVLKALYGNRWLVGRIAQPAKDTANEAVYLSAESNGQRLDIRSESDYLVAAYSAVALAEIATEKRFTGVSVPAALDITLGEVIARTDGVIRVVNGRQDA